MEDRQKLTPNQVVAYNLHLARTLRGWTQEEAAKELEPYIGELWSKATWSSAERSVTGNRTRIFSADDLVAFARCFNLPVAYFLLPPDWTFLDTPNAVLSNAEQIEIVFGTEEGQLNFQRRVSEVLNHVHPQSYSRAQAAVDYQARAVERKIVNSVVGDLERWRVQLSELGAFLEEAQDQTLKKLDSV